MHVTEFVADALGVVTVSFIAVFILLGLFCIVYSFYYRNHIYGQGLLQPGFFSGPWIIRITLILFSIWWGIGEIIRLNLLRRNGGLLNSLSPKWQERVCQCYIVSNLGFAEPCLFLTLVFLLRASLQKSGTLSTKWNCRTAGFVLLYCLPIFVLQLAVILIGPKLGREKPFVIPSYFTNTTMKIRGNVDVTLCTYPLLSTILLGLFATILTAYLSLLGRRILHLVINKNLQKRVYTLIFSISGFFPLRVLFLGLSIKFKPGDLVFEAFAFLAFLSLLCCAAVGICLLVYFPVADSLVVRNSQNDPEAWRRFCNEYNETFSLIATRSPDGESMVISPVRNSACSTKTGTISFCTMEKGKMAGAFVELSRFPPSRNSSPPNSPRHLGWPMLPLPLPPAENEGPDGSQEEGV